MKVALLAMLVLVPVGAAGVFFAAGGFGGTGTPTPSGSATLVVAIQSATAPPPTAPPSTPVVTETPSITETPAPATPTPRSTVVAVRTHKPATPKPTAAVVIDDGPLADPEAAARNEGFLQITVTGGWAEVFVDGKLIDTTPIALPIPLKAGTHQLKLVNPAMREHAETIKITPGGTLPRRIALQPR